METFRKLALLIIPVCAILIMNADVFGGPLFPKSSIVSQKCAACHKPDQQNRLEVIEETRKTPEEWMNVLERMIRFNNAPLEDEKFYEVVKELSMNLCLSPHEMAAVAYINSDENSQYREVPQNDLEKRIFTACVRCHTWGKIASHRNTLDQWEAAKDLHLGYYPTVVGQMRELDWPKESQELIKPLTQLFPFDNPEYREWIRTRKEQDLTGKWKVAGYQPGSGYYEGIYTFTVNPEKGNDEYLIKREVYYANGTRMTYSGQGTLYSKYHLRYSFPASQLTGRIEGVFDLNAETQGFKGKWWASVQDSNAYGNEAFYKMDGTGRIIGTFPQALSASGDEQILTVLGVNLPTDISPADITFSDSNINVTSVETAEPDKLVCKLKIKPTALTGLLNLKVKDIRFDQVLKVYDKIDGIKVFPALGMARVSCGAAYPPRGVQFVARGINFGRDGKPGTGDDLVLEPVNATWKLEEEKTREHDDDLKYLKTSIQNGLYVPVTTYAPIDERPQHREGTGLIAVVAKFNDSEKEFLNKARLVVTVPDFITHIK